MNDASIRVYPFFFFFSFFFFFFFYNESSAASSFLFFFTLIWTYARITSGAPLFPGREDDVTTLSGRPKRREVYRTISCIAAATRHCRLDLRGLYRFLFKKKFVPFFSLLRASWNLSDPPRFLMPSLVPLLVLSHFVAERGHWWTLGLEGIPCRFKKIALRDRTCDRRDSGERVSPGRGRVAIVS